MIVHTSIVHGSCPLNGNWDYYDVEVRTDGFIDVAELEKWFDSVRGSVKTQEEIAYALRELVPGHAILVIRGRHSQNTQTMMEL